MNENVGRPLPSWLEGPGWQKYVDAIRSEGFGLLPDTGLIEHDDICWWMGSMKSILWMPSSFASMWTPASHGGHLIGQNPGPRIDGSYLFVIRKGYIESHTQEDGGSKSTTPMLDEHARLMRFFFGCGPSDPGSLPPSPKPADVWPDIDDGW